MAKRLISKTRDNDTAKRKNPFLEYQKKRQSETLERVIGAIASIKKAKGKISYHTVAEFAERTEQCIRKNRNAALMVERAMAEQRGAPPAVFDSSSTALPTDIHECHAMVRILRADNRELNRNITTYKALIKRYNLSSNGTISEADRQQTDAYKAILQVLMNILSDGVYRLDSEGIVSGSGIKIASKALCDAAGLGVTQEDF